MPMEMSLLIYVEHKPLSRPTLPEISDNLDAPPAIAFAGK